MPYKILLTTFSKDRLIDFGNTSSVKVDELEKRVAELESERDAAFATDEACRIWQQRTSALPNWKQNARLLGYLA